MLYETVENLGIPPADTRTVPTPAPFQPKAPAGNTDVDCKNIGKMKTFLVIGVDPGDVSVSFYRILSFALS